MKIIEKRPRKAAVLFILLGAAAAGQAAVAQDVRVLYSCDFEQGTGILELRAGGKGARAELDNRVAHSGQASVKLVDAGSDEVEWTVQGLWEKCNDHAALVAAPGWQAKQRIRLRKDYAYEVRAHVKTEDAYGLCLMLRAGTGPVRGSPDRYSPIVRGTRDWGWISARVACTEGEGELASIVIAMLGKGQAWVDDVQIVEYPQKDTASPTGSVYPPARLEEVRAETASCVALQFLGDLHYFEAEKPENWLVQSDEDERFKSGVRPVKIGRIKQPDNPDGTLWYSVAYRHTVFLLLPQALQSGKRYRVVMRNIGVEREEFPFVSDERASLNRNIKVNQFGYLPDGLKYAYLGGWLGSAGALPLDEFAKEFLLLEAKTGKEVFRGRPNLRMRHDRKERLSTSPAGNLTGEDVYELDFSQFATPGEYFLVVPGVGRSYTFRIASDIYQEPFYVCARGFLHQRCGIELKEPYTKFIRAPCHLAPALELKTTILEWKEGPLSKWVRDNEGLETGRKVAMWGGYHDACDYHRRVNHFSIVATLLTLYEMFPKAFSDGQLNLPEGGNGIPDIVDEARWDLDFWVRMQEEDGGVHGTAGSGGALGPGGATYPPDRDDRPVYVLSKDRVTTLRLAGEGAHLARLLNGLGKTDEAQRYLDSARKAWAYGAAHDGRQFTMGYAYAALQLWRATAERAFLEEFLKHGEQITRLHHLKWELHGTLAAWQLWVACLMTDAQGIPESLRDECRKEILQAAKVEQKVMQSNAYRMPYSVSRPIRYGWGNGTAFPGGEWQVLAWYATGEKQYRDYAGLAADFSLGCHPTGTVFITGLGRQHVKWALHPFSNPLAKQIGAPVEETVPGVPIFGIHAYPAGFGGWQSQLGSVYAAPNEGRDNFYPPSSQWPDLRLFADVGWIPILSEFGVSSSMGHSTFMYGALLAAGTRGETARKE